MYRLLKRTSCILALLSPLWVVSIATANPHVPIDDDETILIDYQPSTKIPYSKIVRAVSRHFLNFDSESLVSFGAGSRSNIARSFRDYAERTKTRVKLNGDQVELKIKLHF